MPAGTKLRVLQKVDEAGRTIRFEIPDVTWSPFLCSFDVKVADIHCYHGDISLEVSLYIEFIILYK